MFLVPLFVLYVLVFVIFLFLLVSGSSAVCDCGIPWTFRLTFFFVGLAHFVVSRSCSSS